MTRGLHLTGWAYVAATTPGPHSTGEQWFAAMKPYCNAVEVEVRQQQSPPPATLTEAAACCSRRASA